MSSEPTIATVAALFGDIGRAAMLAALADGRALPAGELATAAGVSAQAASAHLAKLLDGGLLAMEREGRHRYYRLAGPEVGALLEGLASFAGAAPRLRASHNCGTKCHVPALEEGVETAETPGDGFRAGWLVAA